MRLHLQERVFKARKLRKKGLSFEKIGEKLGVSEGAVRRWCFDIASKNNAFLSSKAHINNVKNSEIGTLKNLTLDRNFAKIFASILYWAEGTKYPQSSAVSFSNSDPDMVCTFVELLRTGFSIDENKLRVHLQLHSTHNKEKIFSYWSKLLRIPKSQFWKPTITNPTKNMKRRNYRGTCTIRYHDYRVLLQLIGIYEEFTERWLSGRKQRTANALTA